MRPAPLLVLLILSGCGGTWTSSADAGFTSPDAAVADAGIASGDAGAADAGGLDAGFDAGAPAGVDAGVFDAGSACAAMPLATACVGGAVSEVPAGSWGTSGSFSVTEDKVTNPSPVAPADVTVFRPTGQVGVPVLFFSHAFGATDPASLP